MEIWKEKKNEHALTLFLRKAICVSPFPLPFFFFFPPFFSSLEQRSLSNLIKDRSRRIVSLECGIGLLWKTKTHADRKRKRKKRKKAEDGTARGGGGGGGGGGGDKNRVDSGGIISRAYKRICQWQARKQRATCLVRTIPTLLKRPTKKQRD